MKLYIKYMVSIRCKLVVKAELETLGLHPTVVELGEVEISDAITPSQREQLALALKRSGLELMDERLPFGRGRKKAILIERIKNVIVELVHYADEAPAPFKGKPGPPSLESRPKVNFSEYLSEKLHYDYTYLSNLFSEVEGTTIEHFIIKHKIERVKELLVYDELSLTEIAYKLHYSSVSHLSNQFKKITGLTPTFFKKIKHKRMAGLENV